MIMATVLVIVVCAYCNSKKSQKKEIIKEHTVQRLAVIMSVSINGMMFLLYSIALDAAAIHYRNNSLLSDIKIINHRDKGGQPYDILYNVPIAILIFDLVAFIVCIIMLILVAVCFCSQKKSNDGYSLFTVTPLILGPVFGIITHSPFIAIAYINNAYYAGSIFVYYMVVFFVCFAAIHLTMSACLKSLVKNDHNIWIFQKWEEDPAENTNNLKEKRIRICKVVRLIIISMFMLLLIFSTVAIVICYFVIIPLNGSVSGAPHQLIGFYQSIIILLGIFVTYKTVLNKKRKGLKRAIKNWKGPHSNADTAATSKWEDLPDEEKDDKFYGMVIDLVMKNFQDHLENTGSTVQNTSSSARSTTDNGEYELNEMTPDKKQLIQSQSV